MLRDGRILGRKSKCFTLQWHLTNDCELHCRHCYDRTDRTALKFDDAYRILQSHISFCRGRKLAGHVCLTGGNPILYPYFWELYQTIGNEDLGVSFLGNPVPQSIIARIVQIRKPIYYQVSLEGLKEHNDEIRGPGHFQRVLDFLKILQEHGIRANVMLTLTRSNMGQVIPLGEMLKGLADRFTFNRLAQVGEGSNLELPTRAEYVEFMKRYITASRSNSALWFKDSLFNIVRYHFKRPAIGGCTGFGCGAAFNFIAVLPEGEAHACRKFPSFIGNALDLGIEGVYESPKARQYRMGCRQCRFCRLRKVCGGCLAVSYGQGLDVFNERDPYCFFRERSDYLDDF
ncbi:MAG: thio(seleno)oxazole modification radical SAM maturase SbtM [Verrucomicrobiota bacterium]|nr:thio(seleno)oxazole modification radical SAM maturase SbtM [Verrucomicrobiota bacterium]